MLRSLLSFVCWQLLLLDLWLLLVGIKVWLSLQLRDRPNVEIHVPGEGRRCFTDVGEEGRGGRRGGITELASHVHHHFLSGSCRGRSDFGGEKHRVCRLAHGVVADSGGVGKLSILRLRVRVGPHSV